MLSLIPGQIGLKRPTPHLSGYAAPGIEGLWQSGHGTRPVCAGRARGRLPPLLRSSPWVPVDRAAPEGLQREQGSVFVWHVLGDAKPRDVEAAFGAPDEGGCKLSAG